jgi:hypothetical protein
MLEATTAHSNLTILSPLTNDSTIMAENGGLVDIEASVANSAGTIFIGNGGSLQLGFGTLIGNATFAGTGDGLFLQSNWSINGDIVGLSRGDTIDFQSQTFATGDKCVWQQNGAVPSGMRLELGVAHSPKA